MYVCMCVMYEATITNNIWSECLHNTFETGSCVFQKYSNCDGVDAPLI